MIFYSHCPYKVILTEKEPICDLTENINPNETSVTWIGIIVSCSFFISLEQIQKSGVEFSCSPKVWELAFEHVRNLEICALGDMPYITCTSWCTTVHHEPNWRSAQSHFGDNRDGNLFSWYHIYYVHLVSKRFEHCTLWVVDHLWSVKWYDMIYIYICICICICIYIYIYIYIVHELPQSYNREGTLFSWLHVNYVHLASVRYEHSVCHGSLITTYI